MSELLAWVRTVLETTPHRWVQLCEALPVELLRRAPAPGEWSALECLLHLVDAERSVFPPRVHYLLAERDFPLFNPDTEGTPLTDDLDIAGLAHEFARLREKGLQALADVTPADLGKRARHQELGPVTLSELLHEWAAHDLMHTVQAERALMQPFIQGSGPWTPYFSDHQVK